VHITPQQRRFSSRVAHFPFFAVLAQDLLDDPCDCLDHLFAHLLPDPASFLSGERHFLDAVHYLVEVGVPSSEVHVGTPHPEDGFFWPLGGLSGGPHRFELVSVTLPPYFEEEMILRGEVLVDCGLLVTDVFTDFADSDRSPTLAGGDLPRGG
jgi:hypothetical protein